jgi:DNA-binding NtrC family response regulator
MKTELAVHCSNAAKGRVLVFASNPSALQHLAADVSQHGFDVQTTGRVELAAQMLAEEHVDVCIVDDSEAPESSARLAAHLQSAARPTQMLRLVSRGTHQVASAAATICDVIEKPYASNWLASALSSAFTKSQLVAEVDRLHRRLRESGVPELVGTSAAAQAIRKEVQDAAQDECSVLITGEEGTAPELLAQAIHSFSPRSHEAYRKVDCSIVSSECLERELFGIAGPGERRPGCLDEADGGTLFLENVDAVALPLQKKLLHVFSPQLRVSPPSGEPRLDVRLVAASHANFSELIRGRRFREDFWKYLTARTISAPPLRQRTEDVAALSEQFLARLARQEGRRARRLSLEALELMEGYDWPGNLRELWNVLDRVCSLEGADELSGDMLRPWLCGTLSDRQVEASGLTLKEMERKLIETTFTRCGGNRERTAHVLQIGLRTLSGKLREYGYPPRGGPGSNRLPSDLKAA